MNNTIPATVYLFDRSIVKFKYTYALLKYQLGEIKPKNTKSK